MLQVRAEQHGAQRNNTLAQSWLWTLRLCGGTFTSPEYERGADGPRPSDWRRSPGVELQERVNTNTAVPRPNLKVQFGECVCLHVGGTHSLPGKTHTFISWEITSCWENKIQISNCQQDLFFIPIICFTKCPKSWIEGYCLSFHQLLIFTFRVYYVSYENSSILSINNYYNLIKYGNIFLSKLFKSKLTFYWLKMGTRKKTLCRGINTKQLSRPHTLDINKSINIACNTMLFYCTFPHISNIKNPKHWRKAYHTTENSLSLSHTHTYTHTDTRTHSVRTLTH